MLCNVLLIGLGISICLLRLCSDSNLATAATPLIASSSVMFAALSSFGATWPAYALVPLDAPMPYRQASTYISLVG